MITGVKIVGNAGLRVSQVGRNEPVTGFELLIFQAQPPAFGLRIVVAFAASDIVRELGQGLAQQGLVGVAHVLSAPVGVHEEAGGGPIGQQIPMQITGNQCFDHIGAHLSAHHVLGTGILKSAQIYPGLTGQRQVGDVAHPHALGLGRTRLVKQPVGRAALPVGGVGGAQD